MTERTSQNKITGLIHRQQYGSHRQRLAHIKQGELSQFSIEQPYHKGSDYKKLMMVKMYQQKLGHQNKILQKKINQINNRNSFLSKSVNKPQRIKKVSEFLQRDGKQYIQLQSSKGFVLSQNRKDKLNSSQQSRRNYSSYERRSSYQRRSSNINDRYNSHKIQNKQIFISSKNQKNVNLSFLQKDIKSPEEKDILYYNEPERYEQRTIMYKKTHIINSLQSCLVQISMIEERIIIVGYLMGEVNQTLKLFLTRSQTFNVLSESFSDWQVIGSRVYIENNGIGRCLKLSPMAIRSDMSGQKEKISAQTTQNIQKQFIQRNYYTIIQREKQKTEQEQRDKQKQVLAKNNMVNINQVIERLAKHKEYPIVHINEKLILSNKGQQKRNSYCKTNVKIFNKESLHQEKQINLQPQKKDQSYKLDGITYKRNFLSKNPNKKYDQKVNLVSINKKSKYSQSKKATDKQTQHQQLLDKNLKADNDGNNRLKSNLSNNQKDYDDDYQNDKNDYQNGKNSQHQRQSQQKEENKNKQKIDKQEMQNEYNYDEEDEDLIKDVQQSQSDNYSQQHYQDESVTKQPTKVKQKSNQQKDIQVQKMKSIISQPIYQTSLEYQNSYQNQKQMVKVTKANNESENVGERNKQVKDKQSKNNNLNKGSNINVDNLINKTTIYQRKDEVKQHNKNQSQIYDEDFNQSDIHQQPIKIQSKQQDLGHQQQYEQEFQGQNDKVEQINYEQQFDN